METRPRTKADDANSAHKAELADRLVSALTEATNWKLVERKAEQSGNEKYRLDLLLTFQARNETVRIAVEVLRHGYPRDIREVVWQLEGYKLAEDRETKLITMVAAETLSPGAKEQLRTRGIGYFERNGTLYLRWRQWLINIERLEQGSAKKSPTALFTSAREMVVHALLQNRNEWMTGGELAELAETSSYTCSVVLQELERREWVESKGAGRTLRRKLAQPGQLLDSWADRWTRRKETRSRWYTFSSNPQALLMHLTHKIDNAGIQFPWAFSGTAAANVFAPLLTSVDTAEIIVQSGHATELAKALELKPAEKGANVFLIDRSGAGLQFREMHTEYPSYFASPFILYMDLLNGHGRNKELAQHIREKLGL